MADRGPVVTDSDVAAFEGRIGHRLPDDYRRFLLDVNGGGPDSDHARSAAGVVHVFLSLRATDGALDLDTFREYARDLPTRDLLEIAGDVGGNPFLLAIGSDEHRGSVWFFRRSDPRPDDANPRVLWHDRRDMRKLAHSFEEFLAKLGPVSE